MDFRSHQVVKRARILQKLSMILTVALAVAGWESYAFCGMMGGMTMGGTTPQTSYNLKLTNDDCRKCHLGSIPDKHHALIQAKGKQCLDCHKVVTDGSGTSYTVQVVRDCMVCHGGGVHDTVRHDIQSCAGCHHRGTIVQIHTGWRYSGASTLTICLRCHASTVPRVQQTIARGVAGQTVACTDCHPNPHGGRIGGMM